MSTPRVPDIQVRSTTALVMERAHQVRIDRQRLQVFSKHLHESSVNPPAWDSELHFSDPDEEKVAGWILVLDTLNFCFWSFSGPRWQVEGGNGYIALCNALQRAVREGAEPWNPAWLRSLTTADVQQLFRADPGSAEIPLLQFRWQHLIELGEALGNQSVGDLLNQAGGNAMRLLEIIVNRFPSFRDVAWYDGIRVDFYKRAQILVSDLAGATGVTLQDLESLTAFADYKVPQVLRRLNILSYSPELQQTLHAHRAILPGSAREVEIRSATVQAIELIIQELRAQGTNLTSAELDWLLWNEGQSGDFDEPYHRTLSPYY